METAVAGQPMSHFPKGQHRLPLVFVVKQQPVSVSTRVVGFRRGTFTTKGDSGSRINLASLP